MIDPVELATWCSVPAEELVGHRDAKLPITVLESPEAVHRWAASEMVSEVTRNNNAGAPTRWILPTGPLGQYKYFIETVVERRISLKSLHVFHMDELLTWDCRPLPLDSRFSFEGWMRRNFYDVIPDELAVPEAQRWFPRAGDLDEVTRNIDAAGGVDTTFAGLGYTGHIAFNEAPRSPWFTLTMKEFRDSRTRILPLNDDSIIAMSQRQVGGCSHVVPPMAITLGMRDILRSRRIRLLCETGAWKRTAVRVAVFGPETLEYPVTLVQGHPDVLLVIDRSTATAPLTEGA